MMGGMYDVDAQPAPSNWTPVETPRRFAKSAEQDQAKQKHSWRPVSVPMLGQLVQTIGPDPGLVVMHPRHQLRLSTAGVLTCPTNCHQSAVLGRQ